MKYSANIGVKVRAEIGRALILCFAVVSMSVTVAEKTEDLKLKLPRLLGKFSTLKCQNIAIPCLQTLVFSALMF